MLMVPFGLLQVAMCFMPYTFLVTPLDWTFSYGAFAIGILYVLGGTLILTMRRWAAAFAIAVLVVGMLVALSERNVALLTTAAKISFDVFAPMFAIARGYVVLIALAVYLGIRWRQFR